MSKNIALIRFSSRERGNCAAISTHIAKFYAAHTVSKYIISEKVVEPCNHCNYECMTPGKSCPNLNAEQLQFMYAICSADLVYFIIPNYCGYPCANYFVFNERTVGYFNMDRALRQKYMEVPKRFIVISNTEGRNFEDTLKQQVIRAPEILYMKTGKYHKRSTDGDMMESTEAKADLDAFLAMESV